MKTLEGNMEENYHFGLDNFLTMTSKAQITFIKSKTFGVSKDTFKKMKTTHNQNRPKYFANHMSDNDVVSRIYIF